MGRRLILTVLLGVSGCVSTRHHDPSDIKAMLAERASRVVSEVDAKRFAEFLVNAFSEEDLKSLKTAVDLLKRSTPYARDACDHLARICPTSARAAYIFVNFLTALPDPYRYAPLFSYMRRCRLSLRLFLIRQYCYRELSGFFYGLPPAESRRLPLNEIARVVAPRLVSEDPCDRVLAAAVLFLCDPNRAALLVTYLGPVADVITAQCSRLELKEIFRLAGFYLLPPRGDLSKERVLTLLSSHPYAFSRCRLLLKGCCCGDGGGRNEWHTPLRAVLTWVPTRPILKGEPSFETPDSLSDLRSFVRRFDAGWRDEDIRLLWKTIRFWRAFNDASDLGLGERK